MHPMRDMSSCVYVYKFGPLCLNGNLHAYVFVGELVFSMYPVLHQIYMHFTVVQSAHKYNGNVSTHLRSPLLQSRWCRLPRMIETSSVGNRNTMSACPVHAAALLSKWENACFVIYSGRLKKCSVLVFRFGYSATKILHSSLFDMNSYRFFFLLQKLSKISAVDLIG